MPRSDTSAFQISNILVALRWHHAGESNRLFVQIGKPPIAMEAVKLIVRQIGESWRLSVKRPDRFRYLIVRCIHLSNAIGHVTFIPENQPPQSQHWKR